MVAPLVLVSAVLAVSLTGLGYVRASQGLAEQARAALRADARLAAESLDAWHAQRLADLAELARAEPIRAVLAAGARPAPDDVRAAQLLLAGAGTAARELDSIGLLGPDGVFVTSSHAVDVGQSVAQRDYFRSAMEGRPFVSGVSISTITDQPALFHSVPVRSESGAVVGALRSRATLARIDAIVAAARDRVGEGATGVLLDESGLVIACATEPTWLLRPVVPLAPPVARALSADKRWGKRAPPAPLGAADLARAAGAREVTELSWTASGLERRALAVPLRGTRWTYVAAVPEATVQAPARTLLAESLLAAAVGTALAAGVSLLLVRRAVRPIVRLTESARRIARDGDLTVAIDAAGRDEVGELARAFEVMVERLRTLVAAVRESTQVLSRAADSVAAAATEQADALTRHATALQETQVTAHEIQQTSRLAAEKAALVVTAADEARALGRDGDAAVARSVQGLAAVRAETADIQARIGELAEKARQIGAITGAVKDLADQSNMLALNAAIEAARSGEHGRGFAVVAREIRSLADQSIQATVRVAEVLDEVTRAIQAAVAITEAGGARVESGLVEARSGGESLRELARVVGQNAEAARQIAAAVGQQNVGITQVFGAVTDQLKVMEDTRARMALTDEAVGELRRVAASALDAAAGIKV